MISTDIMFEYYVSHHNVEGAMQFVTSWVPSGGDLPLCHLEEAVPMCAKMTHVTRYMKDSLLDELARLVNGACHFRGDVFFLVCPLLHIVTLPRC